MSLPLLLDASATGRNRAGPVGRCSAVDGFPQHRLRFHALSSGFTPVAWMIDRQQHHEVCISSENTLVSKKMLAQNGANAD
jgi:hypothetical protein